MFTWLHDHEQLAWWLAAASLVTFVATLLLVPLFVVRLPADYFAHRTRQAAHAGERHPLLRVTLAVGKNLLGVVFVLAGIAMLVLPGQGVLTIVVGLLLTDFPGKYRVERRLLGHPRILGAMNWIRRRAGREPMRVT